MKEIGADPIDYALVGDAIACWKSLMRLHDINSEFCIPAIVVDDTLDTSMDARNTHVVNVQPLVNMVSSTGESVERPILSVSMLRMVSGRYFIDFPINKGDTGWLIASDRDSYAQKITNNNIDTSKNKGASNPGTYQLHKYSHGFFIPDSWAKLDLKDMSGKMVVGDIGDSGVPLNYMTIDRNTGAVDIVSSTSVSITTKKALIKSEESTTIDSPSTSINGSLEVKKNATINGILEVDESATIHNVLRVTNGSSTVEIDPSRLPSSSLMKIKKVKAIESVERVGSGDKAKLIVKTVTPYVICFGDGNGSEKTISIPAGSGGGGGGSTILDDKSLNYNSLNQGQIKEWNTKSNEEFADAHVGSSFVMRPHEDADSEDVQYWSFNDVMRYIRGLGNLGFNYKTQRFYGGYVMLGRQMTYVNQISTPTEACYVYLEIDNYAKSATMKTASTPLGGSSNSDEKTYISLYYLAKDSNGETDKMYILETSDNRSVPCITMYE